jgi:hypothetical protein
MTLAMQVRLLVFEKITPGVLVSPEIEYRPASGSLIVNPDVKLFVPAVFTIGLNPKLIVVLFPIVTTDVDGFGSFKLTTVPALTVTAALASEAEASAAAPTALNMSFRIPNLSKLTPKCRR